MKFWAFFLCLAFFKCYSQECEINAYAKVYSNYDITKEKFLEGDSIKLDPRNLDLDYDEKELDVDLGNDIFFNIELNNKEIDSNQLYSTDFFIEKNNKIQQENYYATICCITKKEIKNLENWKNDDSSAEIKIAFTFYNSKLKPTTKIILFIIKTKILKQ